VLLAGADVAGSDVAMKTPALLRHGPEHVRVVEGELRSVPPERDYRSVGQLRGAMSHAAMPDPAGMERANYLRALMSWSSRAPVSAGQAAGGEPAFWAAAGRTALGKRPVRPSAARAAAAILGPDRVHRHPPWKEKTMLTCPRCGNPAILMASEEFKLLDCEFCDDVIDVSDQELPELEFEPA
jgi:hypothetical protein